MSNASTAFPSRTLIPVGTGSVFETQKFDKNVNLLSVDKTKRSIGIMDCCIF